MQHAPAWFTMLPPFGDESLPRALIAETVNLIARIGHGRIFQAIQRSRRDGSYLTQRRTPARSAPAHIRSAASVGVNSPAAFPPSRHVGQKATPEWRRPARAFRRKSN
jgi:hypothetical protein